MQALQKTDLSVCAEDKLSRQTAGAEAAKTAESQKNSGLHKITPSTIKSLKTSYDQASGHCVEFGSLWKAGRLARGSVNCLRIFREITLFLPRASVAFGNDLAEHFLVFLEKLADRFDGKDAVAKHGEKPKAKWLAILFMVCVFTYCFNGLKNLSNTHLSITSSDPKAEKDGNDEKDGKAISEAVESALAKQLKMDAKNSFPNNLGTPKSAKNSDPPKSSPNTLSTPGSEDDSETPSSTPFNDEEKKTAIKKAISAAVQEVLDSQ